MERQRHLGYDFIIPVLLNRDKVGRYAVARRLKVLKYIECTGQTDQEIASCAVQLENRLAKWFGDFNRAARKSSVNFAGRWQSTFTWRESGKTCRAEDIIEIDHSKDSLSGRTIGNSEFHYQFRGRMKDGYIVGEWEGLKLQLFGVFQLRIDIDTGDAANGYWSGNGTDRMYSGQWKWKRVG